MLIGGFRFFYTSPLVANKASDSDQLEALSNNVGTDRELLLSSRTIGLR